LVTIPPHQTDKLRKLGKLIVVQRQLLQTMKIGHFIWQLYKLVIRSIETAQPISMIVVVLMRIQFKVSLHKCSPQHTLGAGQFLQASKQVDCWQAKDQPSTTSSVAHREVSSID
jgi:hypothetical protein